MGHRREAISLQPPGYYYEVWAWVEVSERNISPPDFAWFKFCFPHASSVQLSQDTSHPLPWCFLFYFFFLFRATPSAYGGSQARGQIGAVAASLHFFSQPQQRGIEALCLRPTPQLMATLDPQPSEPGQGSNLLMDTNRIGFCWATMGTPWCSPPSLPISLSNAMYIFYIPAILGKA